MEFLQNLDWAMIINSGLTLLFAFGTWYFNKTKKGAEHQAQLFDVLSSIKGNVEKYINEAEHLTDSLKDGGAKFEWVVNKLYEFVPEQFNTFITKDLIGEIVQASFDQIADFAKAQIDKDNWKQ